jgi:hypothetical protein
MDSQFTFEVSANGNSKELTAMIVSWGYAYQIVVEVEGMEVTFEPDENREYRAIVKEPDKVTASQKQLIPAIIETLNSLRS